MWNGFSVERDGPVDRVTLDRPARLNAIDPAMAHDLGRYFRGLQADEACRVVTLRGAGRAFCAGVDLTAVNEVPAERRWGDGGVAAELAIQRVNRDFILAMRRCPQPIVAALHGVACGAGFALALAADIRIARPDAQMNCAFVQVGLGGCDIGVSYLLPRLVNAAVASRLILTGAYLGAEEASRLGLLTMVDDEAALAATSAETVAALLRVAPIALRLSKDALNAALDASSIEAVVAIEDRNQVLCARTADFHEAMAAFRERRSPQWSGR
ncbi:enoyl-CoA hydratase/isomerase family protein [Sphingomonas sp. TX0522]|jgi:enoyl-CoA hydratase/carnithine racemase|uniref:enoyl-CoA hydratase/isomerase family protein n=1 Tax=Sphingomonas sp. TX0522 TaxID=2479205 RepID=UPI0018DFC976|nr:enoyl-CoA hydratase-related protein [Sphingomonas sp. TX0522]MBI0531996.1 enoyl-CoA hydratase/isomerase family protein [Sphingomonas sp. TX0522]